MASAVLSNLFEYRVCWSWLFLIIWLSHIYDYLLAHFNYLEISINTYEYRYRYSRFELIYTCTSLLNKLHVVYAEFSLKYTYWWVEVARNKINFSDLLRLSKNCDFNTLGKHCERRYSIDCYSYINILDNPLP